MLKERIYFIAGIGTDIGKTFLVENLCSHLKNVNAIKPIASGFEDGDMASDSAKIITALGHEVNEKSLEETTPWRFKEALSPHFAAANSGQDISFDALTDFCLRNMAKARQHNQFLFIEAAGGVMTPINQDKTFLDLAVVLNIPVLLVSANYLGAISHTLSAIQALQSRQVTIEQVIINDDLPTDLSPGGSIIETVAQFSAIPTQSLKTFLKSLD